MTVSRRSTPRLDGRPSRRRLPAAAAAVVALAASLATLGAVAPSASAAPGDGVIAQVEVEDGVISGNPGLNSGDHGNFSGSGSYTFRETGMTSTMTVTAPAAGTYPVHVRYAAGPLSAAEDITRSMGLVTNGARQQMQLPLTGDWETWKFVTYPVTLTAGTNTIALSCDRSIDFCRLNFDAIQVGGVAPDACAATPATPGWTNLFDGTFASFDGWRKAGAGGFGRQVDCTIKSLRGRGATWLVQERTAPYTLEVDWRRAATDDQSGIYVASSSRGGADPSGGFRIPIGTDTGAVVPTGGTSKAADQAAVTSALRPVGQWNTYTIRVSRTSVEVLLNGVLVNTFTSAATIPALGFVGLENRGDGNDVSFRRIQARQGVAADSTTTVTTSPTSVVAGQGTVSVSVAVAAAGRTPSGEVEIYVDGVKTSVVPVVAGAATATVGPFTTVGTRSVQARYLGDTTTGPSLSPLVGVTVQPGAAPAPVDSTTTVTTSPASVVAGQGPVSVTVAVSAADRTPSGDVEIYVDGAMTSVVPLAAGTATATVGPFATAGTHYVQARYLGSSTTGASLSALMSVTVQPVPTATTPPAAPAARQVTPTMTLRVKPASVRGGKAKVAVAVSSSAAPTGTVTVKAGRKSYVVALVRGSGTVRLTKLEPGRLTIRATYAGDALNTAASASAKVRVKARR